MILIFTVILLGIGWYLHFNSILSIVYAVIKISYLKTLHQDSELTMFL